MIKRLADKQIKESRNQALNKIIELLSSENIESQFEGLSGDFYSKDKFIVTWLGHWNHIPAEYSLNKTDSFYKSYSGYAATYTTQGLFHHHQFAGYESVWRGLLEIGLKLSPSNISKKFFYEKYVLPYNTELLQKNRRLS